MKNYMTVRSTTYRQEECIEIAKKCDLINATDIIHSEDDLIEDCPDYPAMSLANGGEMEPHELDFDDGSRV